MSSDSNNMNNNHNGSSKNDNNNNNNHNNNDNIDSFLLSMTFTDPTKRQRQCDCDECGFGGLIEIPQAIQQAIRNKKRQRKIIRTQERTLLQRDINSTASIWKFTMPITAEPMVEFGTTHRIIYIQSLPESSYIYSLGAGGIVGSDMETKSRIQLQDWKCNTAYLIPSNGGKAIGFVHGKEGKQQQEKQQQQQELLEQRQQQKEEEEKDNGDTKTGTNNDDDNNNNGGNNDNDNTKNSSSSSSSLLASGGGPAEIVVFKIPKAVLERPTLFVKRNKNNNDQKETVQQTWVDIIRQVYENTIQSTEIVHAKGTTTNTNNNNNNIFQYHCISDDDCAKLKAVFTKFQA